MPRICKRISVVLAAGLLCSVVSHAATVKKMYLLPNQGLLVVTVPASWKSDAKYPGGQLPPTIRMSQQSGERFILMMTPIWRTPVAALDFTGSKSIKKRVKGFADKLAHKAKEKKLVIRKTGGKNTGYYFMATDKAPKPGGYKYLYQGIVATGDLMVTFTILADRPTSRITRQSFRMLGSMKHLYADQ